eukprot:gene764-7293_t
MALQLHARGRGRMVTVEVAADASVADLSAAITAAFGGEVRAGTLRLSCAGRELTGGALSDLSVCSEAVVDVAYAVCTCFSGSSDGTAKMWDTATGEEVRTFAGKGDRWRGAAHHWRDAAQDANWWRSRLRRGWRRRRRPRPSSSESDASGDGNGDPNGGDDWPRAADYTNYHRTRHVLRCDKCGHHTHIAPWLAAH